MGFGKSDLLCAINQVIVSEVGYAWLVKLGVSD